VQPIGTAIRRRREELGYSLTRFAGFVGISPPYLSRIETETRTRPSPEVLARIARGLECQVTDIATHDDQKEGSHG
jgi:transcriptional regulator with XRE-family HTH domain